MSFRVGSAGDKECDVARRVHNRDCLGPATRGLESPPLRLRTLNHLDEHIVWEPLGIGDDEAGGLEHALHLDSVDCDNKDTPIALREPPRVVSEVGKHGVQPAVDRRFPQRAPFLPPIRQHVTSRPSSPGAFRLLDPLEHERSSRGAGRNNYPAKHFQSVQNRTAL
jgi:hypothetical protein